MNVYQKYRARERAERIWKKRSDRLHQQLERVTWELGRVYLDYARELVTLKCGKKVLHAYWGNSPKAWDIACGTDGRYRKAAKTCGWRTWSRIIEIARRMEVTPETEWPTVWPYDI